jgi:hypothetical protein
LSWTVGQLDRPLDRPLDWRGLKDERHVGDLLSAVSDIKEHGQDGEKSLAEKSNRRWEVSTSTEDSSKRRNGEMSKPFNTQDAGNTPYNPIMIDDASNNDASHAQVRRYLSDVVLENMDKWICSVQSSSTPIYNPDDWPQYPPSEVYLVTEPSTLSVNMEHEVPLTLPVFINQ